VIVMRDGVRWVLKLVFESVVCFHFILREHLYFQLQLHRIIWFFCSDFFPFILYS